MLMFCPECGKQISDQAASCPNCGCPKSVWAQAPDPVQKNDAKSDGPEGKETSGFSLSSVQKKESGRVYLFTCKNCAKTQEIPAESCTKKDGFLILQTGITCDGCGNNAYPGSFYADAAETRDSPDGGEADGADDAVRKTNGRNRKKGTGLIVILVCLFFGLVAAVGWTMYGPGTNAKTEQAAPSPASQPNRSTSSSTQRTTSPRSTPKPSYTAPGMDDISATLYVLAKEQVSARLKAPSTAQFCEWRETLFQDGSDDVYVMTGWVDSQNSYGAMLRSTWGIMAQREGNKLVMLYLQIGDDIVYP